MPTPRYRRQAYDNSQESAQVNLAQRLTFAIGGVMALIMAASWWFTSLSVERLLEQHAMNYGRHLAHLSASSAAEPLLAEDSLQLSLLLANIEDDPYILSAGIYDHYGRVKASTDPLPALPVSQLESIVSHLELPSEETDTIVLGAPVLFQELTAGYLVVTLDRDSLEGPLRNSLRKIAIASTLMISLALVGAYLLGRWLAKPIERLRVAAKAIKDGRFELLDEVKRDDEIGEIIGSLNDIARSMHKRQHTEKTLSRFVSNAVATHLMKGDQQTAEAQHVHATVVFLDMVGFTAISEKISAQRVSQMLNYYFTLVNRAAKLYHGTVDKYIGDGVMLVFGSPHKDPEHAFHAICFTQLMVQLVDAVTEYHPDWLPSVQFRIGLHTGDMIAGNLGSIDRMQFTVIGDSVNTAARLCESSVGGEITLSEDVLRQPNIRHRIEVESKGGINLKGKSHTVTSYRLKCLNSPFNVLIDRQVEHLVSQLPRL